MRRAKISSVFAFINAVSALDSTFRRTTGSVLDVRRLKRHSGYSILIPSVVSMCAAAGSYCARMRAIASAAFPSLRLISPDAGNAAWRSATSDFSELFFRHSSSATSSHGIIPLSQ